MCQVFFHAMEQSGFEARDISAEPLVAEAVQAAPPTGLGGFRDRGVVRVRQLERRRGGVGRARL